MTVFLILVLNKDFPFNIFSDSWLYWGMYIFESFNYSFFLVNDG